MAEAYLYRREDITDQDGNVIDTALMRIPNPRRNGNTAAGGTFVGGASGIVSGAPTDPWANAEYRGASAGGRVRQYIRSAAGRMAARNPAERYGQFSRRRNNRYGF